MKKIILLTLLTISLASCSNNETVDYSNLSIVTPTGAPAIALSYFSDLDNFETVTDPNKILPLMSTEQADVVALPTNVGINAIHNKGLNYKILVTITFGNFYIASTGNDKDGIMGPNDYIVSFQQNAVPDKIFHYVHGNELDNALHYVSGAQEAAKCLRLGKNLTDDSNAVDYVLLAEPALSTVLSATSTASVYEDLQNSYKVKSGGYEIFQASIFVKSSLGESVKNKVKDVLSASISEMVNGENKVKEYMSRVSNPETIFGVNPEIAQTVTINGNKLGLGFKLSKDNIEGINSFLNLFGSEVIKNEDIA